MIPISAPVKLPTPPVKLTPPRITAAITCNSNPSPALGCPEFKREAKINALKAPSIPAITKTNILVRSTDRPANLDA